MKNAASRANFKGKQNGNLSKAIFGIYVVRCPPYNDPMACIEGWPVISSSFKEYPLIKKINF